MKKFSLAALAASALIVMAAPAAATDFSFTGNFATDDDVAFFNFNVGASSLVTLVTYSYAGGVNAAGQTIAAGGFDPILSLYDSTGAKVGENDDGGPGQVPIDTTSGNYWDTFFQATLGAGTYTVAVSQYSNFGPNNLSGAFPGSGTSNFEDDSGNIRDSHWAFDVLGVDSATQPGGAVPEPATWAMMITGFAGAGAMLRRRRTASALA